MKRSVHFQSRIISLQLILQVVVVGASDTLSNLFQVLRQLLLPFPCMHVFSLRIHCNMAFHRLHTFVPCPNGKEFLKGNLFLCTYILLRCSSEFTSTVATTHKEIIMWQRITYTLFYRKIFQPGCFSIIHQILPFIFPFNFLNRFLNPVDFQ